MTQGVVLHSASRWSIIHFTGTQFDVNVVALYGSTISVERDLTWQDI